ncbi:MAG: hypothetical protein M4579_005845 [Chaenotheca gracillima]|nr:MAG: hypothetical protein M4579_005845 [Chaenotheca gracillima]
MARKRSLTELERCDSNKLPPELDEALYREQVLQVEAGTSEDDIDDRILQEALAMGLDISEDDHVGGDFDRPSSAPDSLMTTATDRPRSGSTSEGSRSTAMSSHSSNEPISPDGLPSARPPPRRLTFYRSLSFNEYEKFIAGANAPSLVIPKLHSMQSSPAGHLPAAGGPPARRTSLGFKRGIRRLSNLPRQKVKEGSETSVPLILISSAGLEDVLTASSACVCCRDEFESPKALRFLPCAHLYCEPCLHVLIEQAIRDESLMPPRCCNRPLPGSLVKAILARDEQQQFIKKVLQYATPWEDRIFCPNTNCREFIPKKTKVDPKRPSEVVCKRCKLGVCKHCKREAHPAGQDCPADWELDAVLQMGETQGWRRCYKCRALVELTSGCVHMTCRCKAEFCYICGAVWDDVVGCPNFCNGEVELQRRRIEEEDRRDQEARALADQEAADAACALEALEAAKRSADNSDLRSVRERHTQEMDRFLSLERRQKESIAARHGEEKSSMLLSQTEREQSMRDRHQKLINTLEDRQVFAEMELRKSLKQDQKSCLVRLRHMEAYCKGLNTKGAKTGRVITERDRQELLQQRNKRNDMDRLHQARINVLRDKQAQQLEALIARQDEEWSCSLERSTKEMEQMEERFEIDEVSFETVFKSRRHRLVKRWARTEEVARKKLETQQQMLFGPLPKMEWPARISHPVDLGRVADS